MNIRMKIILVVLPLIITTLLLAGISSFLSATTGITRIAREFLDFKSSELKKYAESQWALLVENAFTERAEYVAATQQAIEDYAKSIIRSDTELILALSDQSEVMMNTGEVTLEAQEKTELLPIIEQRSEDLINPTVGGSGRVAKGFYFEPFQWYFLVTEERATFYREVNQITFQTGIILSAALAVSLIMLLFFARYLTRPLIKVVSTMRDIISYNDLSERVLVEYRDEIGQLAHTFNIMIGELEKAYNQIKSYAFKAVLAQKKEQKIRNIFQKYVPRDVIDRFFQNPESMLVGENRMLSVLFSDIRDFTTISESLMPEDLINSLNRYFSVMVDIILNRNGVVDKYMGDAIMAFFGAPVRHTDDALQSVLAGIEMTEALDEFNAHQRKISIGDMVNLASRCEGLTKIYKQPLIITESLQAEVKEKLPFRLLDTVAVKGKTKGVEIFAVRKSLTDLEKRAWETHNTAMKLYYERNFQKAGALFKEIREILGQDHIATLLLRRCLDHIKQPPPENWDGVEVIEVK
jgi:class 3 adenylate cyclase/HAMP domain-containing protein